MLTSSELKKIPIFVCLNDAGPMRFSQQAADVHLEAGEYLIHEGEPHPFFVVMVRERSVSAVNYVKLPSVAVERVTTDDDSRS